MWLSNRIKPYFSNFELSFSKLAHRLLTFLFILSRFFIYNSVL